MRQEVNRIYAGLWTTLKHYIILMGGRGAGRSTVVSQYFLSKLTAPEYFRGAIMRFVLSDVRNSSFQEILDRAEEQGILDKLDVNESLMTISYGANSIHAHGFRKSSAERRSKLKSLANYSEVWIEEADEVPEADFIQMDDSLRTTKAQIKVILTLNSPPMTHWIITRWFNLLTSEEPGFYEPEAKDDDVLYIRSSWKDNAKNIADDIKTRYEQYRTTKPQHYWSMIRGLVAETVKGKIYNGWKEIEEVPHEARFLGFWLDFGFDPDPAAFGALYYYNGGYIVDERLYQTNLLDEQLAKTILAQKEKGPTVADSAEPKAIAYLRSRGVSVLEAEKGPGSVEQGIKHVQGLKISYTKHSKNIKREYENYAWKRLKDSIEDDDHLGIEDPACDNHTMSGIRYGLTMLAKPRKEDDYYDNIFGSQLGAPPKERKNTV